LPWDLADSINIGASKSTLPVSLHTGVELANNAIQQQRKHRPPRL